MFKGAGAERKFVAFFFRPERAPLSFKGMETLRTRREIMFLTHLGKSDTSYTMCG